MKRIITAVIATAVALSVAIAPTAASAATTPPSPAARIAVNTVGIASIPAIGSGSTVRTAQPFATASTGQYEYICIGADGSSWSLRLGEPTTDCHGTFLHKYINGVLVANYKLSVTGAIIDHPQRNGIACLMSVVGVTFGAMSTDGSLLWISELGWSGLGFITSCLA